jgi:hypothetical protein
MQAIDRPMPGRGTPLGAYIKKGADRLLEARAKQFGYGTFRLLVVTDGEAEDQNLVDRYTPEVIARGITVDVIGVAMNERHTLATRVHSYRSANDPDSLKRAVAEVFGEIGGRGNDTVTAETFAEIQPIPAEAAQAMIQALSSSGNHPIGERPPVKREQTRAISKDTNARGASGASRDDSIETGLFSRCAACFSGNAPVPELGHNNWYDHRRFLFCGNLWRRGAGVNHSSHQEIATMNERRAKGWLIAAILWCMIVAVLGVAYKFWVHPHLSKTLKEATGSTASRTATRSFSRLTLSRAIASCARRRSTRNCAAVESSST